MTWTIDAIVLWGFFAGIAFTCLVLWLFFLITDNW